MMYLNGEPKKKIQISVEFVEIREYHYIVERHRKFKNNN